MRSISRLALACAVAGTVVGIGTRAVAADTIVDPTGNVSVSTDKNTCPPYNPHTVSVSTQGCADGTVAVSGSGDAWGFVAVSGTGNSYGGAAVSGTGNAWTDSDTTPVAVSGTGNSSGCGDLGAYAISGTGDAYGCNGLAVAGGASGTPGAPYTTTCEPNSSINVSVFGPACPATVSVSVCGELATIVGQFQTLCDGVRRF